MKALTVKQPWASLIASGIKGVENRSWKVPKSIQGQRIAIHAGKGFDADGPVEKLCEMCHPHCPDYGPCEACRLRDFLEGHLKTSKLVSGQILATAVVVGQIPPGGDSIFEAEWFNPITCSVCKGRGEFDTKDYGDDPETVECHFCCATGVIQARGVQGIEWLESHVWNWLLSSVRLTHDETVYKGRLGLWEVPQ